MGFTHMDDNGKMFMVDVQDKSVTERTAVAEGSINVSNECYTAIKEGAVKKGNVLSCAQIAGIEATKKTSFMIPLCHLIPLEKASVDFILPEEVGEYAVITAVCTVKCTGKTGVEMEALTGVSTALLTIYDMCKAIDRRMVINDIHLVEKHGGRSGDFYYDGERE